MTNKMSRANNTRTQSNLRLLKSRNQREGWYVGYCLGHMRTKDKWASLKGDKAQFFKNWMIKIGFSHE